MILATAGAEFLRDAPCLTPRPAKRFVEYYRQLEDRPVGFWERVVYSLALTDARPPW